MGELKVTRCPIEGLYIVEPALHGDARGWFMETYNHEDFLRAGLDMEFVQDNQSMSRRGVLRGLHFQTRHPQGKLVRVLSGCVFDVAVDLRASSPTFGKWYGVRLTAGNRLQFYIAPGFAHGFLVLSETAEFAYKCTDVYHPEDEGGLLWHDAAVGIDWPGVCRTQEGWCLEDGTPLVLSEKDGRWPGLDGVWRF